MNGFFTFPAPLPSSPAQWASARGLGESDCTFVFHVPMAPLPYPAGRTLPQ